MSKLDDLISSGEVSLDELIEHARKVAELNHSVSGLEGFVAIKEFESLDLDGYEITLKYDKASDRSQVIVKDDTGAYHNEYHIGFDAGDAAYQAAMDKYHRRLEETKESRYL